MDPEWSWMGVNENENENEKQKRLHDSIIFLNSNSNIYLKMFAAQLLFALHTQCVMESPGTYWQDPQVETVLLTQWRSTTCAHRGGPQQKYRISNFCCRAPLWLKEMRVGYGTRKQATPVGTWVNKRNGTELKRTKHTGKKRLGSKNEDVSWPKETSWQMDWRVRATIFCTGFFLHSSPSSTFHFSPLHSTPAWFIPLDSFFLLSSFFFLFFWLGAVRNISANSWSTWKRFVSSNCLTWFSKAFWCQFLWSSTKLFDVQKFSDYSDFPTFRLSKISKLYISCCATIHLIMHALVNQWWQSFASCCVTFHLIIHALVLARPGSSCLCIDWQPSYFTYALAALAVLHWLLCIVLMDPSTVLQLRAEILAHLAESHPELTGV